MGISTCLWWRWISFHLWNAHWGGKKYHYPHLFITKYFDVTYLFLKIVHTVQICSKLQVSYLMTDDRTFQYGEPIGDPRYYHMGPFFIRQPNNTVFNVGRRKIINDVSLLCVARGWYHILKNYLDDLFLINSYIKSTDW